MLRKYPHTFLVEEYAPENRQAFDRHVHTPALYINPNSGRSLKSRLVYLKYSTQLALGGEANLIEMVLLKLKAVRERCLIIWLMPYNVTTARIQWCFQN